VKVGDLVYWSLAGLPDMEETHGGIIVDGPREGCRGTQKCSSYAVHWFGHEETMWHNDDRLELLSESR
jgi:hypothetical protein